MRTSLSLTVSCLAVVLSGCALKGDVRRVEQQLVEMKNETARADSARAVSLNRILTEIEELQSAVLDSVNAQRVSLQALRGEMRTDLTEVQRQLVAIQELTGQSQARLTELRSQLAGRTITGGRTGDPRSPADQAPGVDQDVREFYNLGMEQLRQQSRETARLAFRQVLEQYPDHPLAADAQYFLGETFEVEHPDSAVSAWEIVVDRYPESRRAASALYKLGLHAEQAGDLPTARLHYNRVIVGYPDSDEAQLARAKLRNP